MRNLRAITVFTSARETTEASFRATAHEVGVLIGERNLRLLYGGNGTGLMHRVAKPARLTGAEVWAVFPGDVFLPEEQFAPSEEVLIDTGNLAVRKDFLIYNCDAVLALPGGWGTLDEVFEVITLMQLGQREWMPVVLLNVDGFWTPIIEWMEKQQVGKGLVSPTEYRLLHCVADPLQALELMDRLIPILRDEYALKFGSRGVRPKVETVARTSTTDGDHRPSPGAWMMENIGPRVGNVA